MRAVPKLLPLLAALLLPACNTGGGGGSSPVPRQEAPQRFAATMCELLQSCGCELEQGSLEACVDDSRQTFEDALIEAEAAGMIYDAACLAMLLDSYQYDIGCKTISELLEDGTFEGDAGGCKVVYGTATEGQDCTSALSTAYGDSCVQGLFCYDGICMGPPTNTVKQLGEACDPQTESCVAGSLCVNSADATDVFTCKDIPGLGESCMSIPLCEEGLGCDYTDFTCKEPVGAGEDCSTLPCQDGYYCDAVCVPTLAEGEPCDYDGQCGDGFECILSADGSADVCTPEQPLICP